MNEIVYRVGIEEPIYTYVDAQNGAGPFWCISNSCIVRYGEDVFVSGLETLKNVEPLNNVHWLLFKRESNGWQLQLADEQRQREPCPLGIFSDGRLLLSTNPTLMAADIPRGLANPHLLQFQVDHLSESPVAMQPVWDHNPGFIEHSYRGIGVDGVNHEIVVFNNYGYEEQYWAFLNRRGEWENRGVITYPVRRAYQNIALVNGVCHMQAQGNIMEPNQKWRTWKKEYPKWPAWKMALYQRGWDYVFRRLFYYCNSAISHEQFSEPLEIDNVEATAGYLRNLDLWIAPDGAAHLLYLKKNVETPEMRDAFFPGLPLTTSLEYCIIAENQVVHRQTLVSGSEDLSDELPVEARLHESADGRLYMFYATEKCAECAANYLVEIASGKCVSAPVKLPMQKPLMTFMTANKRNGCAPSDWIDLYGCDLRKWENDLPSQAITLCAYSFAIRINMRNNNQFIQHLVDEAWQQGGGTVEIPAGIYQMRDALHLRDNVHIIGESGTILQKFPSVRSTLTQVCGYGHYEFSVAEPEKFNAGMGVLISDNNAGGFYTTQATIVAQREKYFYIDRPFAHDYSPTRGGSVTALYSLIDAHGVHDAAAENLILDGNCPAETNNLNGCRGSGVFLIESHGVSVKNIEVRQFNGDAISFQQCTDVTVSRCFAHHNSGGGLHPGSGSVRYFLLDNTIENNGGCGIFYCLRTTHSLCEKNTISRNGLDGISVGERDTDHILKDNIIAENKGAGIHLRAPAIQSGDRLWIEGNELRNNNTDGKSAEFIVAHDLHDICFLRNEIKTDNGTALEIGENCKGLFIAENNINDHLQKPDDIVGDASTVVFSAPKDFPAIGPDAASANSARHLNRELPANKKL